MRTKTILLYRALCSAKTIIVVKLPPSPGDMDMPRRHDARPGEHAFQGAIPNIPRHEPAVPGGLRRVELFCHLRASRLRRTRLAPRICACAEVRSYGNIRGATERAVHHDKPSSSHWSRQWADQCKWIQRDSMLCRQLYAEFAKWKSMPFRVRKKLSGCRKTALKT